jgi:effector-binding domain-containing protein
MKLTEEPDVVAWPQTPYVFIEKTGPFQKTGPQAWQELHQQVSRITENNQIKGHSSLYKMSPNTYRAGVSVAGPARDLPEGLEYTVFEGGKYSRFLLTGSYSNRHQASRRVFEIVSKKELPLRLDYCIENYANDPRNTPQEDLVTESNSDRLRVLFVMAASE